MWNIDDRINNEPGMPEYTKLQLAEQMVQAKDLMKMLLVDRSEGAKYRLALMQQQLNVDNKDLIEQEMLLHSEVNEYVGNAAWHKFKVTVPSTLNRIKSLGNEISSLNPRNGTQVEAYQATEDAVKEQLEAWASKKHAMGSTDPLYQELLMEEALADYNALHPEKPMERLLTGAEGAPAEQLMH